MLGDPHSSLGQARIRTKRRQVIERQDAVNERFC